MVVLLQNGHELEGCEGPAHIQLGDVPVQSAEDAEVVAADEEDLIALQFRVVGDGLGNQLHMGNQDAECLGEKGDDRVQFDLHDGEQGVSGISGEARGRGESDNQAHLPWSNASRNIVNIR